MVFVEPLLGHGLETNIFVLGLALTILLEMWLRRF